VVTFSWCLFIGICFYIPFSLPSSFFCNSGIKPRVSCMLCKGSTTELHPQSPFSYKDINNCNRTHPNPVWPHHNLLTSAKTLSKHSHIHRNQWLGLEHLFWETQTHTTSLFALCKQSYCFSTLAHASGELLSSFWGVYLWCPLSPEVLVLLLKCLSLVPLLQLFLHRWEDRYMPPSFIAWDRQSLNFCMGWPQTVILPISVSWGGKNKSISHCA
jgi:hypothetical protein